MGQSSNYNEQKALGNNQMSALINSFNSEIEIEIK